MKTLQKRVQVLYRFRCERCRSKFEMTEEEKLENDWKFDDHKDKERRRAEGRGPMNTLDYFDCPVCGCKRYVMRKDMHRFAVMDDGTEIMEYWSKIGGIG